MLVCFIKEEKCRVLKVLVEKYTGGYKMKERLKKRFFEASQIIGVTSAEHDIVRYCCDVVKPLANSVEVRPNGTVIAEFKGSYPGPKMQIDAHVDEIGIMVRYIDSKGFIYFDNISSSMKMLMGARIIFNGNKGYVYGITSLMPGHVQTAEEANSIPSANSSCIDVGACSYEEVLDMGIDVGTTGVIEAPAHEMYNKDLIVSRAVDNRMSVSYLLELAHDLKDRDFAGTVCFTFSTTEEINCYGASHAAAYLNPDWAIALDTIPAGGTPGVSESRLPVYMGKGPVFSYADQSGNGSFRTTNNRRLIATLEDAAIEIGIPYQKTSMYSVGGYVTTSSGILRDGNHCPVASIATPRRYSHTPVEMIDLNDCERSYKLLCQMIKKNGSINLNFLDE